MSDIVERLEAQPDGQSTDDFNLHRDAIEEIERLRSENEHLRINRDGLFKDLQASEALRIKDGMALHARVKALEVALTDAITELRFVEVFVKTREHIKKPEGEQLFDELLARVSRILAETGAKETTEP